MSANDISEREALSALFDGELQGDARRFASRRLAHDTGWQDDCGRWQLMGDAMRRQAPIAAPAGFAARVERAIAAEATVLTPAAIPAAPPRRPVRLWAGGALVASLALLAVFAARSPQPVARAATATVAAAPSQASATPSTGVAAPQLPAAAGASATTPSVAAAASEPQSSALRVATVDPATTRAAARRPSPHASSSLPRHEPSTAVAAATTFPVPDAANPFHVPATDPLATRPWPRAALSGNAALTASYGAPSDGRVDSPSFYPFEPRTHAEPVPRADTP